ncbi:unnamed protein product [Durusdinium trenchii]|uniref:Uncharacterized protein n=2 Tax=Durusdinium trenchii TaxID=1381693 RepID=A0ABP0KA97_9DINO
MSREKATVVHAIDKCLDQKDATYQVVGQCYNQLPSARSGAISASDLQAVLTSSARSLGLPAQFFMGKEQIFESFDLNGNGMIEEDEAKRIIWKLLQHKRLELAGRRPIKVPVSSVVAQGYSVVKELGRGGQGTMYLCTKRSWFRTSKYCIKFYEKADANAGGLDELMDEYALMSSLDNPHIAKTYEVFQDKSFYYLVNEPYFGGDLTKLGKNAYQSKVRISENWWRGIFRQCLEGLCYLHTQGVMHCDIKEPNIMIAASDYQVPHVVLIDFGLSTAFTSNREGVCGTPGYIPPETWRTGVWYPRGDVFSMGVVFFQCVCGMVPTKNGTVQGALVDGCRSQDEIASAAWSKPLPWERFPGNMPLLQDIIELMTLRDRSHRPRALQAANHEWFHGSSDVDLPASSLQGLIGCADKHQVIEELTIRLGEANTLHAMRQLLEQFQKLDRHKQGTVEDGVAYELLVRHAVPTKVAQRCVQSCGRDFPYVALMNDILASKERYGYQYILELFQKLDVDHSGSLSVGELRGLIGSGVFQLAGPEDVDRLLSWMDVNKDGTVSFDEFLNVALEFGQISSRAESDEASTSFWAGLGLRGWASAEPATSIGAGRSFQPREPNIGGMPSQQQGVDSLGQRAQPVQQEVQVWRLRVGILNAEGAPFIDPMQFHSAYVICSLCGEDPQSDAVELFRTHAVGYSGQASWNIEEDLLDYQPPDGLELSVVCQGAGNSEWLLGSARLQHRQFFPLGCNTRLTLVRAAEGIQGTLWVKVLVMEDNGTPVSEAPLQEPSPPKKQQQWAVHPGYHEAGSFANATGANRGIQVTWGKRWVENRQPHLAAVRQMAALQPQPLPAVPQHVYAPSPQAVPMMPPMMVPRRG